MKHKTFDGGPPSNRPVEMAFDVFSRTALLGALTPARLSVIKSMVPRLVKGGSLCGACDHEFAAKEFPRLLWALVPGEAKGPECCSVGGAICVRCAELEPEELGRALFANFKQMRPDAVLVEEELRC